MGRRKLNFFTKKRLFVLPLLLFTALAGLAHAQEEDDLMGFYFDQSEMVETASRAPRLLNRTAENVTVIKASEIERLHAHNIYEVLGRVPGVAVAYANGQNMNGYAYVNIQGSRTEHVLVLLDGVRFNTASGGDVSFATLPVGIIERIEIIKGPASAAWGSSLGGVINILTKKTGTTATPEGSLMTSYGEAQTWELNGDVAGTVGRLGYYLYGGRQQTDGFVADRHLENDQVYGKVELPLPRAMHLTASMGLFSPEYKTGDFPRLDFDEGAEDRHLFASINLTAPLGPNLHLNIGARHLTRDFEQNRTLLGLGLYGGAAAGDLFYQEKWEEESSGASIGLTWNPAMHQVMLGGEFNHGEVSKSTLYGAWAQTNWGSPIFDEVQPVYEETWGLYLNDTITMGDWAVTPGLRYDEHSISDSILSPSLGLTYQLREDTLLRAVVSQGFIHPVLSFLQVSDWAYPANQDLRPEKITSYQLGLETDIIAQLHFKTNLFLHEVEDSWVDNWPWENGLDLQRQGFDLEIATAPVSGFSAVVNVAFVKYIFEESREDDSSTTGNLILRYDHETLRAELAGHYVWWDKYWGDQTNNGDYGNTLWDLRLDKKLFNAGDNPVTGFFTAHNLFDGSQYHDLNYVNPGRWLEAGLKLRF